MQMKIRGSKQGSDLRGGVEKHSKNYAVAGRVPR